MRGSTFARRVTDRLLMKEPGCGIGPDVARRLVEPGVRNLDVSVLDATSWVRTEPLRASVVLASPLLRARQAGGLEAARVLRGSRSRFARRQRPRAVTGELKHGFAAL